MHSLPHAGLLGHGVCTPGLSLERSRLASGNPQEDLFNFAVSYGDWFLPFLHFFFLSCEKLLAKESTFFLLTGSSCLSFL